MNIETYRLRKIQQEKDAKVYRSLCMTCRQPTSWCYCSSIRPFDPKIKFVILIHPVEERRRIATGRMSHLCLENSELICGQDYSQNTRVNEIIADPQFSCVVLYPGKNSLNLSTEPDFQARKSLFESNKIPVVFVIDGTWATAGKMLRQSQNLISLPRVCFTPATPSRFRVRKQPKVECYSTIEAIHQTIELLGDNENSPEIERRHDRLLEVFNFMVENQVRFLQQSFDSPKSNVYRRPRVRVS